MKKSTLRIAAICLTAMFAAATPATAQVAWNWSFGGEAGQFITNGSAPGGVAAPGNYTLSDFIVNSSTSGATTGSYLGGEYGDGATYSTFFPYSFDWNGSAITRFLSAGYNTFDWWAFADNFNAAHYYVFGWSTNNVNDVSEAAYFHTTSTPSYKISVAPAGASTVVPEPSTFLLMGAGVMAVGLIRRRRA